MKDPLDRREDAYQRFNDEAARQNRPHRVGLTNPPLDVRRLFGPLRPRASDPEKLQEAYDRLTHAERRLEEDVLFYWVPQDAPSNAIEEPEAPWCAAMPVPSVEVEDVLIRLPSMDQGIFEPQQFQDIELTLLTRYDEVELPWPIEFAK